MFTSFLRLCGILTVLGSMTVQVAAEDWPTHLHDARRSGVTAESLVLPLWESWRYRPRQTLQPTWPAPARQDLWHEIDKLNPRVIHDRALHVAAVDNTVYFGSSADDRVYALDAMDGAIRWTYTTEAPVRIAPTVVDDRVYAGSDDGWLYCLDAADGRLIWKYNPVPEKKRIAGNGRLISPCPVRTSPIVEDGTVQYIAGLFPLQGVFLCTLNATDGSVVWKKPVTGISPQGYLLASPNRLYVPNGRANPAMYDRADGRSLGSFGGPGGTYALLPESMLIYGPGDTGQLVAFDADTRSEIASFNGRQMVTTEERVYLQGDRELSALDRVCYLSAAKKINAFVEKRGMIKKALDKLGETGASRAQALRLEIADLSEKIEAVQTSLSDCIPWKTPCTYSDSLIRAGDLLFAGGDGAVAAFRTTDGERVWEGSVQGRAYGLAVANGLLLVSTDRGVVKAFETAPCEIQKRVRAAGVDAPNPNDALHDHTVQTAERILKESGVTKGYCLVIGSERGRLAFELATRSELIVVGVEDDPEKVADARARLADTPFHGSRISFHQGSLSELPYGDCLANLVVSDRLMLRGELPGSTSEIARVLQPETGVVYLGQPSGVSPPIERTALEDWLCAAPRLESVFSERDGLWVSARRASLPGAGEWTHLYADPGNTACSGDERVGSETMQLQWFGRPGPHPMIDRHHRTVAPLYKAGRLFIPGNEHLLVLDAYNGSWLWGMGMPSVRRVGALKDCGSMAIVADRLYAVVDRGCRVMDTATGELIRTLPVPQAIEGEPREWGYIAALEHCLIGSGQKLGASRSEHSRESVDEQYGDKKPMVTSDYLFGMNPQSGEVLWTYRGGAIINPTIAAGDGHVYFVESTNAAAMADPDGRMLLSVLMNGGVNLVAVDVRAGNVLWKEPLDLSFVEHILYLAYANGTLVVTGTKNRDGYAWYYLFGHDAATGDLKWSADHHNPTADAGGVHGEQVHHPVIAGNTIFAEPVAYNLQTGERVNPSGEGADWTLSSRHGCGTISGSASCLFFRDSNPSIHDTRGSGARAKITAISRPGCWINIIPAGGLVMIPEASSGCTCAFPVQTSMAFLSTATP